MTDNEQVAVRPLTLAWVHRHLASGERVVRSAALHGGITADMRVLTIGDRQGRQRQLVLRSYLASPAGGVQDALSRELTALTVLRGTEVPAPQFIAVDLTAQSCEYPSLLMSHLPGRTVLDDSGVASRVQSLAGQLVAIHAVQPAVRPPDYLTLTTAKTVMTPSGADPSVWAAAIEVIGSPTPPFRGRFLHRDFQPGNVLFGTPTIEPTAARISGVVDWAGTSWGPTDLDVAH